MQFILGASSTGSVLTVEVVPSSITLGQVALPKSNLRRACVAIAHDPVEKSFFELVMQSGDCEHAVAILEDDVICTTTCKVTDPASLLPLLPDIYRQFAEDLDTLTVSSIAGKSEVGKAMFDEFFERDGQFDLMLTSSACINSNGASGMMRQIATLFEVGDEFPMPF